MMYTDEEIDSKANLLKEYMQLNLLSLFQSRTSNTYSHRENSN